MILAPPRERRLPDETRVPHITGPKESSDRHGSLTSALHVYYRDLGHALPLILQLWMFATPIAYPLSLVPEGLVPLYLLNPMASIIQAYRHVLLAGELPNLLHVSLDLGTAAILVSLGYLAFKRAERTFADAI